ncbi:HlyD family type I secretion periplasmic adaptor subunit [Caulobacter sp. 17J65-9]|uniref:HlyD family type I secretion periplasmic adaptor subunit n=1 Tax=Caulobacter sp. 17J65-9 TaxID=2709382 RepID=UPI0013CD1906|nr:HlyD family type I secretion periplasmic adaptor subunit [Caulobacter sp. 17J65-9]NEX94523.1 HlyD family type I secretion periplasmic adaptor subunit [Caulobacter sp. 17J65-9]
MTLVSQTSVARVEPFRDDAGVETRIGGALAGAFFVGFLGWAAFAPLDAGAHAQGVVAVSGNRQAVQHREGGVITALRVKEGDRVAQGQVLIEVAAGELRATERALTSQVLSLKAQRARLIAERDGLAALAPPPEFAALPAEDRELADQALRLERMQFTAHRQAMASQRGVLAQRVGQLEQQIQGQGRQLDANSEQQRLVLEELDGMRSLEQRGYAPKTRVRALERSAAGLRGEDGALRADTARAREAIGETRMQMVSLERQSLEEVVDQLRRGEEQLNEVEPRLSAAREQLARAQVRAPVAGDVVGLSVFTVGGVVQPGQALMEIVPRGAPLVVEARVSPNDADGLRVGQPAEVRFPSFHQRDLPKITGRLTRLSADSFTDERTGVRYFRAEVAVPPAQLAALAERRGGDTGLKPGLPVQVVVALRKRTALQYLLEPLEQTMWRSFRET